MNITHFQAMILFALAVSFAFAFLSKHADARAPALRPVGLRRVSGRSHWHRLAHVPLLALARHP